MYCTCCGKQIDYNSHICDECLGKRVREGGIQVEPAVRTPYNTAPQGFEEPRPTAAEEIQAPAPSEPPVCEGIDHNTTAGVDAGICPEPDNGLNGQQNGEDGRFDSSYIKSKATGDKKFGFKRALASVITGTAAIYAIGAALGLILESAMLTDLYGLDPLPLIIICAVLSAAAVAAMIVGLVCGIKSILAFKSHLAETGTKPIPTLVLGIIGTGLSAEGLLYVILAVFYFSVVISSLLMFV